MRRALFVAWCLLLAGIVCIAQSEHVSAFWQSRDSNYNQNIASGGSPIGAVTKIFLNGGNASSAVAGTVTITTIADAPAGSLNVVLINSVHGAQTFPSTLLDSAGNTYSQAAIENINSLPASIIYYCSNTASDLPSGGTIAIVTSESGMWVTAVSVASANGGLDVAKSTSDNSGTATSISLASGALGAANEIIFAASNMSFGSAATLVEGTFNSIDSNFNGSQVDAAQLIVSSTASKTYNPSWTGASPYNAVMASFK